VHCVCITRRLPTMPRFMDLSTALCSHLHPDTAPRPRHRSPCPRAGRARRSAFQTHGLPGQDPRHRTTAARGHCKSRGQKSNELELSKWGLASVPSHRGRVGANSKRGVFLPSDVNSSPTRWPHVPEQLKADLGFFLHCCGGALMVKMRQLVGPNQ